jgi:hypothetical protein
MRITAIDFEGKSGYFAHCQYKDSRGKRDFIDVVLMTPDKQAESFIAHIDEPKEILQASMLIQRALEGIDDETIITVDKRYHNRLLELCQREL